MVMDLVWFGDGMRGIELLRYLKSSRTLAALKKIVIYSMEANATDPPYREILLREFGIPETQVLYRQITKPEAIADQF